jgi:glucan 1,3-beta-glucosidase
MTPPTTADDAMMGMGAWNGFLENSDRVSLDNHPYFAFDTPPHTEALSAFPAMACNNWGGQFNTSFREFGLTQGGEFSFAINDCGLWVTNVDEGTRYEGTYPGFTRSYGSCDQWTDATDWDADRKEGFKNFIMAGMDATTNYFFWTCVAPCLLCRAVVSRSTPADDPPLRPASWKIGASTQFSHPVNPMWNYQQGLKDGYAPTDPREADGYCASIGIRNSNWDGTLDSWMTGGAGAGVGVVTTAPWPPASMSSVNAAQMTQIPQLTQTGTPVTLAGP